MKAGGETETTLAFMELKSLGVAGWGSCVIVVKSHGSRSTGHCHMVTGKNT